MNEHDNTQRLIPWYVNGSLDEPDMALVDRHLPGCSSCRETLAEAMHHTRALNAGEAGGVVVDSAAREENFQRLQVRLQSRSGEGSVPTWRHDRRTPRVAALAAGLLLAVGVSMFWWPSATNPLGIPAGESSYQAMTSSAVTGGPVVQVIFHGDTSERDIRLLLLKSGGELLGNPSPKGVYRIALPDLADVEGYATRLRQHPAIRWAELER